jgi:outer membrane protein OmpA-like peptidoglycan-associated protein
MIVATMGLSSGCIASRKFVRNEVKTSSDTLNARVDKTDGEIKETRDNVDRVNERVTTVDGRVTTVDGKVSDLDSRTTQGMNALKGDVNAVNTKADRTNSALSNLDEKFAKRNNFAVTTEKTVLFKFDSDRLDSAFNADLDEVASALTQNADAIVVLEGHTDSTGNQEYNVRLGERRVEAVKRYLAVEKNVPVYKIHVISFGSARPVADNQSRDGREKNRSVSLAVLVPKMEGSTAANQ